MQSSSDQSNMIEELICENNILKQEILELKEHLSKYTYGNNHKKYYENNKEKVMENASKYLKKLKEENPEKLKEYRRRAYENRKLKMSLTSSVSNTSL